MSDSDVSKSQNNTPEQRKVLDSIDQTKENEDKLISNLKNFTISNCDDDDNDVIVVKIKKGCEPETLETNSKGSTVLLDRQLAKIHIDSKDSVPYSTNISDHQKCLYAFAGTRPKILGYRGQKNIKPNQYNNKQTDLLECECENLKKNNGVKETEAFPSETMKNGKFVPTNYNGSSASEYKLPCVLHKGLEKRTDITPKQSILPCSLSKQNLPTLLKSQSLDLYNDDCSSLNIDQQIQNRLLPNINEYRATDSQIELSNYRETVKTEKGQLGDGEIMDRSIGEACQSQPDQSNIATSVFQSPESRPIYPNVPYSPYGSPYGSPRSIRRRPPLRESRRISIEKSGSFLQLNQYKLMDQIGQGSYGLVKLAYSEEDSTHYAMKILSKKRLLRQAALMRRGPKQTTSPLDRVYREIAVLKKLDHPNVVKLVEVLDDPMEDSLYMVFELVKKGEVLSIPTKNPLSEERAWSVFRDSLLGLEYLHYQKIIHADLKPGNLLLTEGGQVKIADLGVCNEFLGEDATMSNGSTAGTPAFRAPETLLLGKNVYCGRAADIWALGATLYSFMYGNVPFTANSVPLLYEKIKHDEVVFLELPKISDDARHCIVRMLEKDPANRITLPQLKMNPWVTSNGLYPLPTEDENCCLVQVDEEDINSVVRSIPKLDTLILIKTMLKNHSFGNPFVRGISGKAPQPGGSRLQKFIQAGRSNSAPGSYHMALDRQPSTDNVLPSLIEHCSNQKNDEI